MECWKIFFQRIKTKNVGCNKGISWDAESIKKRADSNRGKKRETTICPHCNKEVGKAAMIRWHNENCKKLIES